MAGLGEQTGLFTVDYVRGGKDGKGTDDFEKMTRDALKKVDLIIFANTTLDLPMPVVTCNVRKRSPCVY